MRDARCGYRGSEAEKKFSADDPSEALRALFRERVEFYLKDVEGYSYDVVNAVLVVDADDVRDILLRAAALKSVSHMPEFQSIGAACKRIRNILRQANEKDIKPADRFKSLPDSAPEEKQLAAFMETTLLKVESLREARNYREALLLIANAREPVDAFFDNVMVMVPHEAVRANRLALLQSLLRQFSTIADFSEIVAEGKPSA
jgi:glycyl-tRNA synthetase beta chain